MSDAATGADGGENGGVEGGAAPHDSGEYAAPPPTGRFSRFWKLSSLGSGVLASRALGAVKKTFAGVEEKKVLARAEANLATAMKIADTFGELKGAVMKLGQVLSIQEDAVPPEFREVLAKLQSQAPPMHPSYAVEAIQAELGAKVGDLFGSFERRPIASASLGQVHAATLRDGTPVVVKVQYPGIEKTIRADLKMVEPVVKAIALTGRSYDMREMLEEVEARLGEELDYEKEAANQEALALGLASLESVRVPRVIRSHSRRRVITMDRLEGVHLDAYVARAPSRGERHARARILSELFWTMECDLGVLHADPHPGNFLFLDDGRIGLLDFGCMKRFDDAFLRGYVRLMRRILARDDEGVLDMYERMGFLSEEVRTPERVRAWLDWSYLSCRPFIEDRPWPDPSRGESWSAMIREMHESLAQITLKVGTYTPRDSVYLNRVSLGMMCFWTRLDASLNWHRLVLPHLERAEKRLGEGPVRTPASPR
jgi:predicted unusual protein kinase regulating ubiquinone biosynthesis (AarF/ABC1/UbiB family)